MSDKFEIFENIQFYHGFARYGQFGDGWVQVITACYYDNDELLEATDNLCAGDIPAFDARDKIMEMVKDGTAYIGTDRDPVEAMKKCIKMILEDVE